MPNLKISAMPGLGVNAAPGDLLTIVDVSAPAASANKHETLNNLLSVITRGITDKALRFQTPGTAPAVSLAAQGSIYFDGSNFQISANGGAYAPLLSLSPQADHAVLIGPTSGGPTTPTWRGLALSDLPAIATNRLLGRVSPSSGDVEEITPGTGVLTWLQNPTSDNLRLAVATTSTGAGALVFDTSPTITNTLKIRGTIEAGATTATISPQISFIGLSAGPFHSLEIRNATTGGLPLITVNSPNTSYGLSLAAKGTAAVTITGSELNVTNSASTIGGIVAARGGSAAFGGGTLRMYEQTTNGSNFWAWRAPDLITVSVEQQLPDGYGNAGDGLITDGFGVMSWAPVALTSGKLSQFSATTSAELAGVISDETGSGALVFGSSPTIATPTITTSAVIPILNGGTAASSSLILQSTSGAGTSDAIIFRTASQSERARLLNNGNFLIGTTTDTPGRRITAATSGDCLVNIRGGNGNAKGFEFTAPNGNGAQVYSIESDIQFIVGTSLSVTTSLTLNSLGHAGILTGPTCPLDVNGDKIRIRTGQTPASNAAGNQGDIAWGTVTGSPNKFYLYVCVAANTWTRVELTGGY